MQGKILKNSRSMSKIIHILAHNLIFWNKLQKTERVLSPNYSPTNDTL